MIFFLNFVFISDFFPLQSAPVQHPFMQEIRKLSNNLMEAKAASSSAYVEETRDFVAQERASAGASIAAPPEQVLDMRA